MSAFLVTAEHIAAVVGSAQALDKYNHNKVDSEKLMRDASTLALENARSVAYRYREKTAPVRVKAANIGRYLTAPLAPVALIKAIACLEYQSCETDDWKTSDACKLLDSYLGTAINALPGYDAAAWAIDDRPAKVRA